VPSARSQKADHTATAPSVTATAGAEGGPTPERAVLEAPGAQAPPPPPALDPRHKAVPSSADPRGQAVPSLAALAGVQPAQGSPPASAGAACGWGISATATSARSNSGTCSSSSQPARTSDTWSTGPRPSSQWRSTCLHERCTQSPLLDPRVPPADPVRAGTPHRTTSSLPQKMRGEIPWEGNMKVFNWFDAGFTKHALDKRSCQGEQAHPHTKSDHSPEERSSPKERSPPEGAKPPKVRASRHALVMLSCSPAIL
jgi:hypothetical protein